MIFKVFAQGRTSNLDGAKGGRLEPAVVFDVWDVRSVCVGRLVHTRLSISNSGARGRIKPENKTEVALSVEKERKPLISPPFRHQSGGEEGGCGCSDS